VIQYDISFSVKSGGAMPDSALLTDTYASLLRPQRGAAKRERRLQIHE
jgi:hypothetical protein